MASKKGKKSKGTTLSLQEFNSLHEGSKASSGQNVVYVPKSKQVTSWADEVEEDDTVYEFDKIALPSAPRAVRGPNVDESQIPKEPPYQAHLGNLSYDIQDDDVDYFFRDLKVVELRLPRDQNSNRLRGFGYVEFATREDLIQALCLNETMLKGRAVRVNLQGPNQGGRFDNDGGRRGGDRGGDRGEFPSDETPDDWRSSMKPTNDYGPPASRGGYDSYNRRDRDDRGPRRDMYGGGGGMPMMGEGGMGGMDAEFDFDRSSMNQGPPPMREGPPRDRDRGYDRGDRGFDRGDRGGDRGFDRGGDRGFSRDRAPPSYEEQDEGPVDWRSNMKPREDPPMRSRDRELSFERRAPEEPPYRNRSPADHMDRPEVEPPKPEPPRERKKLVLAPRTAPLEPTEEQKPEGSSSIFGGAKPVDTAARERQIEEKLAQSSIKPEPEEAAEPKPRDGAPAYRILKRDSSERSASGSFDRASSTDHKRNIILPPHAQDVSATNQGPARTIQILRPDRERTISSSSITSSKGTASTDASSFSQNRTVPSRLDNNRSNPRSPSNLTDDSSMHLNRRKSDSEGERDDEPRRRPVDQQRSRRYNNEGRHGSGGRRTPDSDRNAEKEKDSHSEPEDDRDTHRYVVEKSYSRENDDVRRDERPRREIHLGTGERGSDNKGEWNRDGPRRQDAPRRNDGPRRGGGGAFDDREHRQRRDFQDSDRGEFRRGGDNRRAGPGRQNSDDRDFNLRSRNTDIRLDRNFSGNNRAPNRRGGPALQEKSARPNRNFQRDDVPRDKQYDSEGFEIRVGRGVADRPLPKHTEERQPINTNVNKFGALQTDDNEIGSD